MRQSTATVFTHRLKLKLFCLEDTSLKDGHELYYPMKELDKAQQSLLT